MKTKNILTTLAILLCSILTYAQSGDLDLTFDPGKGTDGWVYSTSIQSDGKIIIGGDFTAFNGTARNRIARLNTDGSLDSTFNPGTGASEIVKTISIQTDGKIIITGNFNSYNGTSRNRIARLNTDGSLDISFNPGTGANDKINTSALQSDGKIIIGGLFGSYNGTSRNGLARVNTDGSLDLSFDPAGGSTFYREFYSIAIQSNGKIIIGGGFIYFNGTEINRIVRLNTDGSIDNTFNPGTGADLNVRAISIQSDGKIIIGGDFYFYNEISRKSIARLNTDGSLDLSFDPGTGANRPVYTISIQYDKKIIIGGLFWIFNGEVKGSIARLNTDGSLDLSFNTGTGANERILSTSIQSDGKIIIGGGFYEYNGTEIDFIARLTLYGTSVPNYDKNESRFNIFPNPFSSNTTLQSDYLIQDGTLTIYNSLGELVTQYTNINGQSVTINRGNLANGLYFIRLTEGKHELMMKKVMVVD